MYGSRGPPRRYSTPRGVDETTCTKRTCQKCGSKEHWTFECKNPSTSAHSAARSTSVRLSRSQQLRLGIKQPRREFVPEPTEWEAYKERVREVEKQLIAEARKEAKTKRQRLDTGLPVETKDDSAEKRKLVGDATAEAKDEVV